jgi:DNA-binding transcriptional MerR regulator
LTRNSTERKWMTTVEVAGAFGVTTARIRRLALDGRLPSKRLENGARIYPRLEIEALAKTRKAEQ